MQSYLFFVPRKFRNEYVLAFGKFNKILCPFNFPAKLLLREREREGKGRQRAKEGERGRNFEELRNFFFLPPLL